jgi:uncharacterized protein YecT (DUF1311 family)
MKPAEAVRAFVLITSVVLGQPDSASAQVEPSAPATPRQYVRCTAFDLVESPSRAPQDKNCPSTALFRDPREPLLPVRACKESPPSESDACSSAFLADSDERLNTVYREARAKLLLTNKPRERQLVVAQREWLRFRAAHCDEQSFKWGKTKSVQGDTFHYRACLDLENIRRTHYLEVIVLGRPASTS